MTQKTDAARMQNALRVMYSLDEVNTVLPEWEATLFHRDPMRAALRMDAETWSKVYALVEARQ